MSKKKSIRRSVNEFRASVDKINGFLQEVKRHLSDSSITLAYELAAIKLYAAFERMILECLVGAINNDTSTIAGTTGIRFPKHLTDEVCLYLIVGTGYFDFKGRDDLIRQMKQYVPSDHYLVTVVANERYKEPIEHLSALRNYASHDSAVSKARAKRAVGSNMGSSGSWLKTQNRYENIAQTLVELAGEIGDSAPY